MNGQPAAAVRFCRSRTLKGVWMGWMTSRARVSSWSNHMLPGQAGLMTNLVAPWSMYSLHPSPHLVRGPDCGDCGVRYVGSAVEEGPGYVQVAVGVVGEEVGEVDAEMVLGDFTVRLGGVGLDGRYALAGLLDGNA